MPSRRDVFINNHIYHIYNKTIDHRNIFNSNIITSYFLAIMQYYRSLKSNIRYSEFKDLEIKSKIIKEKEISSPKYFKVEILCYCFMPNHFHFLIKQKKDQGIIRFMSDIANSLTRYYNVKNERKGPIFLPQFKSRVLLSSEQLNHVSRYIHLNPYTGHLVKSLDELLKYTYSSFPIYINKEIRFEGLVNTKVLLANFDNDILKYKNFVFSNGEHQKTLEILKHLNNDKQT